MREENANIIKNVFRPNQSYEIGWTNLNIDEENGLFTIPLNMCGDTNNPPIFKFEELVGYELEEEDCVIERFHQGDMAPPQCTPMIHTPLQQFGFDLKEPQKRITRDLN